MMRYPRLKYNFTRDSFDDENFVTESYLTQNKFDNEIFAVKSQFVLQ